MNEVRAEVVVPAPPARAFAQFTDEVDNWWRRGERYGGPDVLGHRFEPWVGGRFLEISTGGEAALGRITAWEPPHRLAFTWRQGNWRESEITAVEVLFRPAGSETRVLLRHHGFDAVQSQIGCEVGYRDGWAELLSWYGAGLAEQPPHEEKVCT